jgi:hypothetical protein
MALAARKPARLAEALLADGPNPEHAEALMLFGQLVGEWECDWAGYDWDGRPARTERGEWIFGWVLEGRAVQDVWIIPSRERRSGEGRQQAEYGTTIRVYDPLLDAWLVTWNGPIGRARRTFVARRLGDAIVQDGQSEEGYPLRWIFSEIAASSFSWRSLCSRDGEKTWPLREEMRVRRKTG